MPETITLDVVDRPDGGTLAFLARVASLRRSRPAGLRAVIPLGTAHFSEWPWPRLTPRRAGVLAAWESREAAEERWPALLGHRAAGASEHWHVTGEVTRASFSVPWRGWTPAVDGVAPLGADEPALVLIAGDLKGRWAPVFFRDAARTVRQAHGRPGFLGGLALASALLNTTSCSAWRRYDDARAYAYAAGAHRSAMQRDRREEHHRTEWFTRVRPLAERGTLAGRAPFAGLLRDRGAVAA